MLCSFLVISCPAASLRVPCQPLQRARAVRGVSTSTLALLVGHSPGVEHTPCTPHPRAGGRHEPYHVLSWESWEMLINCPDETSDLQPSGWALSTGGPEEGLWPLGPSVSLCLKCIACQSPLSFTLVYSFSPSFLSSNTPSLLLPQAFAPAVPTA